MTPGDTNPNDNESSEYVNFITANAMPSSMTLQQVKEASLRDDVICAVIHALEKGDWSDKKTETFRVISHELSVNDGILLKCNRIVLPKELHQQAIEIATKAI